MTWFVNHIPEVAELTWNHAFLAVIPLLIGLALALPLGWAASRHPRLYVVVTAGSGVLYTIPSLAMFILLPLVLGTRILDPINVIVALSIYTVALLTRTIADGLNAVPGDVIQAATAMGIGQRRRFMTVELPLAIPVIAAGLRVAAVSNVSIVSVAALLGISQLGSLFTTGFAKNFLDPILVGIVASMGLALLLDLIIILFAWLTTPWLHRSRA